MSSKAWHACRATSTRQAKLGSCQGQARSRMRCGANPQLSQLSSLSDELLESLVWVKGRERVTASLATTTCVSMQAVYQTTQAGLGQSTVVSTPALCLRCSIRHRRAWVQNLAIYRDVLNMRVDCGRWALVETPSMAPTLWTASRNL